MEKMGRNGFVEADGHLRLEGFKVPDSGDAHLHFRPFAVAAPNLRRNQTQKYCGAALAAFLVYPWVKPLETER